MKTKKILNKILSIIAVCVICMSIFSVCVSANNIPSSSCTYMNGIRYMYSKLVEAGIIDDTKYYYISHGTDDYSSYNAYFAYVSDSPFNLATSSCYSYDITGAYSTGLLDLQLINYSRWAGNFFGFEDAFSFIDLSGSQLTVNRYIMLDTQVNNYTVSRTENISHANNEELLRMGFHIYFERTDGVGDGSGYTTHYDFVDKTNYLSNFEPLIGVLSNSNSYYTFLGRKHIFNDLPATPNLFLNASYYGSDCPFQTYFDFSYWCNNISLVDDKHNKHNLYYYSNSTPNFQWLDDDTIKVTIKDGYMYYNELLEDNQGLIVDYDDTSDDVNEIIKREHNKLYTSGAWYLIKDYSYIIDKSNVSSLRWSSPVKQSEVELVSKLAEYSRHQGKVNINITDGFGDDPVLNYYLTHCNIDITDDITLTPLFRNNPDYICSPTVITRSVPNTLTYEYAISQYNNNNLECLYYYSLPDLASTGGVIGTNAGSNTYNLAITAYYKENNNGSTNIVVRSSNSYIKVLNYDRNGNLAPYYIMIYGTSNNLMSLKSGFNCYGGFKTLKLNFNAESVNSSNGSTLLDPDSKDFYLNKDGSNNGYNSHYDYYDDKKLTDELVEGGYIKPGETATMGSVNKYNGSNPADMLDTNFDFTNIDTFYSSMGNFWNWFGSFFSFMPDWFWALFGGTSLLIIFLRILGR